jgi:hypothetical protein
MLPKSHYEPSIRFQHFVHFTVPAFIYSKFFIPEFLICFRLNSMKSAAVPETAVDKNGYASLRKYDVWPTGDFVVEPVTKPRPP